MTPQSPPWAQNAAAFRRKLLPAQPLIQKRQQPNEESIEMQDRGLLEDNGTTTSITIPWQRQTSAWMRFSWTTLPLIAFSLFLTGTLAALVILRAINHKRDGFNVAPGSLSYSWKFGPTATFVVVIAFWRLLDYMIRCQAAWREMTKGPATARKSLLLDYLSPLMPVSVVTASRNRHWDVVLSVAVFACMKIAVVFSTGLLALEPTTLDSSQTHAQLSLGGHKGDVSADEVALSYIGASQRDLPWPARTLPNAAFQELLPHDSSFPANSTVNVDVRAFYPSLGCQVVNTTAYFNMINGISEVIQATELVLSYHLNDTYLNQTLLRVPCNYMSETCDAERIAPLYYPVNPVMWQGGLLHSEGILVTLLSLVSEEDPTAVPLNFTSLDSIFNLTVLQGRGWTQSVAWISAIICKSAYSIETGQLSAKRVAENDWINIQISDPLTHTGAALLNYSSSNLTSDVDSVLSQISSYRKQVNKNPLLIDYSQQSTSLFEMMLFEKSANDVLIFKDAQSMIEPVAKIFQGLASTWVGTWLSFPNDLTAPAHYTYTTSRLRVSELPLWLMFAALAAALACVVLLFFRHTNEMVSAQSGLLVQDAVTLKTNPALQRVLAGLEHASDAAVHKTLSKKIYHTCTHDNDRGNIVSSQMPTSGTPNHADADPDLFSRWTQMAMQTWFIVLTLSLALLIIVGLEIVQKASDANSSGLELKVSIQLGEDLVTILSALVMVTLALMFTCAEFVAVVTYPYLCMTKKTVSIQQAQNDPFRQLPPVGIAAQLWFRCFSVAAVMFAALLGSTLTVIVSGLYTIQSSPFQHTTNMLTIDEFDFTHNVSSTGAGSISFTYIQRGNQSYPAGTYEEIAYPLLQLSSTDSVVQQLTKTGSVTSMEVLLPVIRPSLNCTTVPQSELSLKADEIKSMVSDGGVYAYREWANVTSISDLPIPCQNMLPAYHDTLKFSIGTTPPLDVVDGKVSRVAQVNAPVGVDMDRTWQPTSFLDNYNNHYPAGCPSVAFTIGTYTLNQTDTSTTTRLVCSQYFEGIPASMTFFIPGLELDISKPPILHEDRAYIASIAGWNFTNIFEYDAGKTSQYPNGDAAPVFEDSFFQAIVNGTNGVPFEQLQGPQNVQKLIDAVQRVYRLYMAQVIGNDMRIATGNPQRGTADENISSSYNMNITRLGTSFPVFVVDPTRMRIVQNRTAKLILQVVIAVMMACLIFGWRDLRAASRIFPHNPCTIAGRMSYLARSRLVDSIPDSTSPLVVYKHLARYGAQLRFGWWENGAFIKGSSKAHIKAGAYAGVNHDDWLDDLVGPERMEQKRFGIDIVM